MEHLQWAMRRDLGLDFPEARDEAGVAHQLRDDGMVRMAAVQRMGDHYSWLETPDYHGNLRPGRRRVLNASIRQPQILPRRDAHHLRRLCRFLCAELRSSSTRELPSREIEDARRSSQHLCADQR